MEVKGGSSVIRLKLKEVLESRGITQKELSSITGINEATISSMCRDTGTSINKNRLAKIMDALGVKEISEIIEYIPESRRPD